MNVGSITCVWYLCFETDALTGSIAGLYRIYFFTMTHGFYFPTRNAVVDNFGDLVEVPA